MLKAADAYLANGDPDKALKYFENMLKNKKRKKMFRINTFDSQAL
jgi:pentatricopeptide repeat protein